MIIYRNTRQFYNCTNFVFVRAAHNVEEQIYITSVDTSQAIQHNDLCIRSVCLAKQTFLKSLLFL